VALLVVMFVDWYRSGGEAGAGPQGLSAWQAYWALDVILAVLAVLAIAPALLSATRRSPALPVAASVVVAACAIVALALLAYRIVDQPGPNDFIEVRIGAFFGFVCVLGIAAGAWSSMSADDQPASERDLARVEVRPAPPAGPGRS
jgi:hypothetical protein